MHDNFSTKPGKRFAFFARQSSAQRGFVRDRDLGKLGQSAFAFLGENQLGMSAILRAASPFNQVFLHQLVDQKHHPTGKNAQEFGETLLI